MDRPTALVEGVRLNCNGPSASYNRSFTGLSASVIAVGRNQIRPFHVKVYNFFWSETLQLDQSLTHGFVTLLQKILRGHDMSQSQSVP
jgi:hypothetical protein